MSSASQRGKPPCQDARECWCRTRNLYNWFRSLGLRPVRCEVLSGAFIGGLATTPPDLLSLMQSLDGIAMPFMRFLGVNVCAFDRMRFLEAQFRCRLEAQFRFRGLANPFWSWFRQGKCLLEIDQLVRVVVHGAPVHVTGVSELNCTIVYSNHSSAQQGLHAILAKYTRT